MKDTWLGLEGKVAIVTGGASGIGKAIATELVDNGSKVVISDISSDGNEVIEELNKKSPKNMFIKTDITKIDEVKFMIQKTIEEYGKIDILVNNAGINIPRLLVDPKDPNGKYELNEAEFDLMVSINQKGTFLCAQCAAREMIKNRKGVIVNITSESGLEGSEGQSCYAGTKGAIYALTRSWAKELGKYGIRVVGVAPGIIEETGLRTNEYEESLAYTRGITVEKLREGYNNSSIPLRRVGKLEEIANLVCFLASDRASYIHGVTYNISGGKSRG
ncbi:sorbitol-6-phosphate 2-dehydrogenase [Thermoanaerobacterium thermosaccharolyticum]|uniref:Sorbitol-6-phosphate 2-dehydrogenase n=1 Tax=Thermoanaerobacterium thermosaccharolyticum TaxID=1517 RepID=A0A223HXP5_THETR|nr:SDR family oxidoreductase [Thermoanaerobacterium thermosaccharolyticum]AST57212.1 sorbitol-6-phosphate 2-dehydrogenase [Thermoanaerobacterium thermosaccharolyticum]